MSPDEHIAKAEEYLYFRKDDDYKTYSAEDLAARAQLALAHAQVAIAKKTEKPRKERMF